jgi:putative ABC transport system substrate-binding protein
MRKKTSKSKAKPADKLLKTSKKKDIELTEKELDKVTGGRKAGKYLVRERVEALQLGVDPLFGNHIDQIVALATRDKIPTIYPWREFTAAGGLMNYGASIPDAFRQVGVYTGQILKGAMPADLPVQRPTELQFALNLKTAKALGLQVPDRLLALADEIFE